MRGPRMMRVGLAAGAIGIFVLLCWDANRRLTVAYPSIYVCLAEPEKFAGKPVWLSPSRVVVSEAGAFVVNVWGDRIRVLSTHPPPLGVTVMVYGTFQADQTVKAIAWSEEPGYHLKRKGVVGISLLVLLAGVIVFLRTFTWRDGAIHPR